VTIAPGWTNSRPRQATRNLSDDQTLAYDRLVVSPGIDVDYNSAGWYAGLIAEMFGWGPCHPEAEGCPGGHARDP
jgi:hypothetical protein